MAKKAKGKGTGRALGWMATGASERTLRQASAFNEAGHVLVALAADVEINYVVLDDAVVFPGTQIGAGNGSTVYVPPRWYEENFANKEPPQWPRLRTLSEEQRTYIFKRTAVSIGGELAEQRWHEGHQGTPKAGEWEKDDVGYASMLARYLADGDMDRAQNIMDQATVIAGDLLDQNWPLVERIARALVARTRLNGADLQRL